MRIRNSTRNRRQNVSKTTKKALLLILAGVVLILGRNLLPDVIYGITKTDGVFITHTKTRNAQRFVSTTFRIYNLQGLPLKLKAMPDCGCTFVSWKSTTIYPYRWAEITATMEVKSQNNQSVVITFLTNRVKKPYLFATLNSSQFH